MRLFLLFSAIASVVVAAGSDSSNSSTPYLTATALVTDTTRNVSAFECWELTNPFQVPSTPGISGALVFQLNTTTAIGYTQIPPRFDGGVHNAPHAQWVMFASGLAHITLPNGTDEAWVMGGLHGLILALDTTGYGHRTTYPTDDTTLALTLPCTEDKAPAHKVLSTGPCQGNSQVVTE